jgi:Tfp pilus assembly protein PilV
MSDLRHERPGGASAGEAGFTLVEVMISGALMGVALLAVSGMFVAGYADITSAGRSSVAVASARQVIEDVRGLPFESVVALDGFDTDRPDSVPQDPEAAAVARRWRYTLAGDGANWPYSQSETQNYPGSAHDAKPLGAGGRIDVDLQSATLAQVRITVVVPGARRNLELTTLVADR